MARKSFDPVNTNVNFPKLEEEIFSYWKKEGIEKKYLHKNDASKKRFSFLDGPITANNPMGVHHAWGRTYKDLWQRFHTMLGDRGRYQNGFDCQGLWVEVEVEKELGIKNKKDIENLVPGDKKASIAKFVELCKERVRKYSAIQTEQTKRLGNFMDWNHSYFTMSNENNYMIWHFLKVCHEKGWVYKSTDVVPWCPRCQTAISQHEILTEDYKEVTHDSLYLKFPLEGKDKEYLMVWTTTPWTVPANIAVAVDTDMEYALVEEEGGDRCWVGKALVKSVFGNKPKTIVRTAKGNELVGWKYEGPFDQLPAIQNGRKDNESLFHTVIATDQRIMPISNVEGTGLVHTSTGTGEEDSKLGKKIGLPVISAINDVAEYLPDFGFLRGKNAKKHPELILNFLKEEDSQGKRWIFQIKPHKHRYPVCWRCKTELVWKVSDVWYIGMDREEICKSANGKSTNRKTLREQMVETAKMITWHPSFGLERELDWLSNMHDWLISKKNRYWGLALPIYECSHCGSFEVIGSYEELKTKAVSGWEKFEGKTPHKPFIDEVQIACPSCKKPMKRIDDVGNVWLDAGIVPFSTYVDPTTKKLSYTTDKKYWKEWFPPDFITESFPGQFKNWFYSMIAMSTVLEKRNPFQTVLGYASMLGEDGRPMHKSLGNAIEFNQGADAIGADVMRWLFCLSDPEQNILFGYKKADETRRKFHLMLWNVYNFFVTYANADGWKPIEQKNKPTHVLDRWILSRLNFVIEGVTGELSEYKPHVATALLEEFLTDLSQWYVRRSRNRVGPTAQDVNDKNICYETLYHVLTTLMRLLAPFIPYMTEEIYRKLTHELSVHLSQWPESHPSQKNPSLESDMAYTRLIVEKIHAKRKELKIPVRQPLAKCHMSHVTCHMSDELVQLIKEETNIKTIILNKGEGEIEVELDTTITPELEKEGKVREVIRTIQQLRKEKKCAIDEKITLTLPGALQTLGDSYLESIKQETLSDKILWGDSFSISTYR